LESSAQHFERWFIIQGANSDTPLSKLSAFVIEKAIKCSVGTVSTVKRMRSGDLLVEATSAAQGKCISKLTSLAITAVTVSAHRTLNTSKGVIRCRELIDCDKAEIMEELKTQGVSDINNITVKGNDGDRRNTNTFIVTFSLPTLPKHIKIGYLRVPVAVYVPNPLRCFKCQRSRHGLKVCRREVVCAKCGQTGHSDRDCRNEAKCPNCSGSHSAFSRDCPKWIQEKQVQIIKAEKGVSFPEARRLASSGYTTSSASQTRSTASVIKQGIPTSRLSVCSVHTQTELTNQTVRNHLQQFLQSLICRLIKLVMATNQNHPCLVGMK